jgi:hypothetical protein
MVGSSKRRDDTGASAVEFALVCPLLFLLLFGVLQYGLYFSDANSLRQGVREAARAAVVENFTYPGCAGTNTAKLICATKSQIGGTVTGSPEVKVYAPEGWTKGKSLRVCAAFHSQGAAGLLPMPDGGNLRALTQMTIEQEASKASWADAVSAADPSGGSWSWC